MADMGIKLGVDGEREFKKALSDINQQFKVLGSEMKLATSEFEKNEKSIGSLTSKNEVLTRQIDTQKDKITTLRAALENASDSFGETDKRTQQWVVALNNAEAELNDMERELKSNEKAIDDVADEFDDAEKQADQFGDELEKTGKDADESGGKFEKLGSIVKGVATAIGAAMAAIGAAAIAAGKELYNMVNEVAAAGDNIDKMSQRLGLSAEAYQEWDFVLSQSGVDIDTVSTGMKTLTNTIDDAKNGATAATDKFARLGITQEDLANKSREDIFAMTIAGLQQMTDDTEKAALANDMFGKSGQEMIPLLNQTAESTQALIEKAHEMGMVMSDEAVGAAVEYTDAMDTLQRTFTGVKNNIVSDLLPGFTMVLDGLSGLLVGQEGAAEQIQDGAREIVSSLSSILPQVMDVLMTLVMAVAEIAPEILVALINGITDNLDSLIETASSIVMTLLQALITALPQLAEGAIQLVMTLVQGILDNLPMIVEAAIEAVVALAMGIADALPQLIPSIVEAVILICQVLIDNLDKILEAAFAIIAGLAEGLLNALPKLMEALPQIITTIINFITNNLPLIIQMGIELVVQLAFGLIKAIPQLVAAIPQIIAAIVEGLGKAVGAVFDIGKNIVQGLWEGIKSLGSWLADKVGGFFSGIVDGTKNLLGIHSPSTVFAGIGENMGEGIGVGFTDAMKDVEKDIENAIPTDFDIDTQAGISSSITGGKGILTTIMEHTGIIRVEGVNDSGALSSVVDIILGELRQEVRV